ncbi:MAG: VOC family protein [Bryobacterales bacterium]|nr:VOC family protein [Bryobacterales bacterium]
MSYKATGFTEVTPYLTIEGAAAAMEFYRTAFGAVETYRQMTEDGKVRHAQIRIGEAMIMISDYKPEYGFIKSVQQNGTPGLCLFLYVPDADATFASALAAGANEVMAMSDQEYGRTGGVQDPFGVLWWVTTHKGE